MKRQIIFLFFFICISCNGIAHSACLMDSIGLSVQNGEKYIIHEVEAGETLFALSRKYLVEVQSIKDTNAESLTNLRIGQRVLIPIQRGNATEGSVVHTVKSSETLFSISRLYNVKVDELKIWNNLKDNSISIGQRLIIKKVDLADNTSQQNNQSPGQGQKTHTVEQSQTLYSISRMYGISTDQLREWNDLESSDLKIGQVLIVASSNTGQTLEDESNSSMLPGSTSKSAQKEVKDETSKIEMSDKGKIAVTTIPATVSESELLNEADAQKPIEKVTQKGLAEVIENTSDTKKYLALHREAPVGTIMQVRNEMNNQSVFVRIVGPIPNTGDNSKVILKISKKAYDRLGAVDNRFPVEISYIP